LVISISPETWRRQNGMSGLVEKVAVRPKRIKIATVRMGLHSGLRPSLAEH
jgi:hypothetical protein